MSDEAKANSVIAVIKKNSTVVETPIVETTEEVLMRVTEDEGYASSRVRPPDLVVFTKVKDNKLYKLLFNKRYIMYVCATRPEGE